jgi:predicted Zn-dependent protease
MTKRRIQWVVFGFCLTGLLLWVFSCATNPVSGKKEFMLLSEGDEVELGHETDPQIIREYGIYDDPKLATYFDGLCQRLGKLSHRPQLKYHLKILDASVVNAFAVPGGYVYFSRGILAVLNNEAELAGVMGHEIGHIAARHSAKQYSRAQLAQMGLGVGAIFVDSTLLTGLAQVGVGMLFLRFSRDNERQADDLGVEYSTKAGYDASEMANFFETLERMNPGSDRSGLPGWFSTHPSPEDRVKAVRTKAKEWQQKLGLRDLKVNQERYLKEIDGLVFGEDPRQGYVEENTFYHPTLHFQFPVPDKWELQNRPSQIQIISGGQEALILFFVSPGTSPREAARTFVTKTGATVIKSDPIHVNGFSSHRMISDILSQQGSYRLMSYFIEKGKNVFIFHGMTSSDHFQKYRSLFDQTMSRFRELSDPKKINVKPNRIRIRSIKTSDTLENELRSFGVPNEKMKEMALLNGRDLKAMVPPNTLLKVVEKGF